jgi:polysaccharide biosynthesis transport protein
MPAPVTPQSESRTAYPSEQSYSADYSADLRKLWHNLIERVWMVILCVAVFATAGVVYVRRAPVLYSSTATIKVEQSQQRIFKDGVPVENLQALDFLQTVVQSLKARPLLARVAESNNLAANPKFVINPVDSGEDPVMKTLDELVSVRLRRGTRLIDVTVKHTQPELTSKIANSLVREYIDANSERHVESTTNVSASLTREAERLKTVLEQSERKLQAYREEKKASSLDERQNTVVAELKELSTKATEAKSVRIKAETDYNQVLELGTNVEALLTLANVANDPTVVASRIALSKAEEEFAILRQRYKDKHPKFIQATSQIQSLQRDMADMVLKASHKVKAAVETARAAETALNEALRKQEASALELSSLAIEYGVLSRQVEADRALYESVLNRMKETGVTKELQPTTIQIVQPAYVPPIPVSPRKIMILALSGMGGLVVGLLIVLCLGFIDTSIKTVDDAESLLGVPVLASIPQLKEARKDPLLMLNGGNSAGAEGFRTLRAALSMLGRVEDRRVFLFTSAVPQEGKTFSSVNYAASLAQLGLKTLLIDGDLRRPKVATTLNGHEDGAPGVTDYLTGQKSFEEVIHPTQLEKLFYIAGGTPAPNPAELLARDGLSSVIQEALKTYDRVVVDSAPIHAVSDTLMMLKNVQTVCLVVRASHTSNRFAQRCVQLLQAAGAPLSGVVMNRMPTHRGPGYGYYEYRYQGKFSKKGVYGSK